MTNFFDSSFFDSILDTAPDCRPCFYINATSQAQTVLIRNIDNSSRQRVVFPGQRLVFEAATSALLVILNIEGNKASVIDVVPCRQLRATSVSTSTKSALPTISSWWLTLKINTNGSQLITYWKCRISDVVVNLTLLFVFEERGKYKLPGSLPVLA